MWRPSSPIFWRAKLRHASSAPARYRGRSPLSSMKSWNGHGLAPQGVAPASGATNMLCARRSLPKPCGVLICFFKSRCCRDQVYCRSDVPALAAFLAPGTLNPQHDMLGPRAATLVRLARTGDPSCCGNRSGIGEEPDAPELHLGGRGDREYKVIVNLKTAKELGLTIPPFARADEVID